MADNVPITAGSGTNIATDDTGAGGHVQIVKLAISTDGSATLIPGDAANGIDVDVTRLPALPAGTNNIGDVDVLTLPAANPTRPATSAVVQIASSASNVTLDASNGARLGLYIFNASTSVLYVKLGATASTTSYSVQLGPNAFWELPQPIYTGIIDGIWSAANGFAYVTELTA